MNLLFLFFLSQLSFADTETLGEIQVLEHQSSENLVDFLPSVKQIKGEELHKKRKTSLGDTLSNEAGVNSTSFGPSSSRPVIRGLDGDRIRILQNSVGTLDASTQSLDHAVPIDLLTVDQIEIVRGPMGLLYGSSAVGGVVNIVTNKIHHEFNEGLITEIYSQGETVNSGINNAVKMDYGKNQWMFHVDASTRNIGDQRIPRYVRSSKVRVTGDDEKHKVPNSFNKQDNLSFGTSRIFERGHIGASLNHFTSNYGSVAEEEVTILMNQNRGELHAEYRPEGGFF